MERYFTFPEYCRQKYGRRLIRIPLNGGFTCPNRDGRISYGGCVFCDEGGSGDFASVYHGERLCMENIPWLKGKEAEYGSLVAYFQAYTNTYGPIEKLRVLFSSALRDPAYAGLSIATRPDCLPEEVMELFSELRREYPDKFIWVELGLQTMHEETAKWIRRGYDLDCFDHAVQRLHEAGLEVIVHVIVGLPEEGRTELLSTIRHLNQLHIEGIKIHLLHVLRNTELARQYEEGLVNVLSFEEYVDLVSEALSVLSSSIAVHRLTGDGPRDLLLAPLWSLDKKHVLNEIRHAMKMKNYVQGCRENQDD